MSAGQDQLTVTIAGKDVGLQAVLQKVDKEMAKSADSAVRLGQSYARLAVAQGKPAAAAQILAGTIGQAGSASERALIGIQTQAARTNTGLAVLPRTLAGLSHEAASFATGMVGIGTAISVATAAVNSFSQAFQMKAELDATTLSINAQLKGLRDTGQVWREASAFANEYKLTTQETTDAIQASVGVMRVSKASVEDVLGVLARLQVLSPEQSLQEAALAVKALASGDITSLVGRFEVSRDTANQMKQEIQGGADAVSVLSKFLGDSGIGMDVLKTKTEGASGKLKELAIANEQLALAQAQFAQGPGLAILEEKITILRGATRLLSGDFATMGQSALQSGTDFAVSAAGAAAYFEALQRGQGLLAAEAAANAAATEATQLLTQAHRDGGGGSYEFAAAEQTLAEKTAAATAAAQASADAALVDAAQKAADQAATDALTSSTNAAVTAFLALYPTIDAAGIAAQVAAGKIPALIGQLAGLRIAAYSARDAIAALAAQQAINTKSLVAPGGVGVNAPGITSGRNNDIDAVLKLQKANKDAADARSDQIIAVGTDQQKLNELEKQYGSAVKASGAESAAAIQAETRLKQARAATAKAAAKGAGGKGGGAVKLSDQQKLQNSLLTSQETYENKSEQAEADHFDRLLDINADFQEKMKKAQDSLAQSQLEGRASFYDSLGSIEDAGLRQALAAQYEAAFAEADKIAQEKGADVGEKFLEARQAAIQAQGQRASEIAEATKEGDKDKAEYLAGVDKLYRAAEERRVAAIAEGKDSVAAERDKQLLEESAKYADAQAKIGESADQAAQRKILASQRAGQQVDVEKLKVDNLKTSYDQLGVAGSRAGITPAPGAGAAPGTTTPGTTAGAATPTDDPIVSALHAAQDAIVAALGSVRGATEGTTSAVRSLSGKFAS